MRRANRTDTDKPLCATILSSLTREEASKPQAALAAAQQQQQTASGS